MKSRPNGPRPRNYGQVKPSITKQVANYLVKYDFSDLLRRRVPLLQWITNYKLSVFFRDALAGFTVGLTEIPQGIAYAVVAGLEPRYGLYSGFMGCFMYFLFGSCKDLNIGPTAIMALMIQPYVGIFGADVAVLITFLSGCIIFALGLFNLGFLVEFFSYPVISGFTSAAALQIGSSQIKSLLGIPGKSNEFLEAWKSVFTNISHTRWTDTTLGVVSIIALVLLKELRRFGTLKVREDWSRKRNIFGIALFMISLARNALIVVIGTVLAFILSGGDAKDPFILTGNVGGGLPGFHLPPFSTTVNGTMYEFSDLTKELGTVIIFAPLVAVLESIAIAKAFSKGRTFDATQELFALGICNIMGSFVRSMPVTGSFTRTAVNNASGVKTTLGGIITGIFVLLALSFLTSTFYYIPKTTLASVVICAMFYLFDFEAFYVLWKNKKLDLIPFLITLLTCLFWSLEYGILVGTGTNLVFVLYDSARPKLEITTETISNRTLYVIWPRATLQFPSAEYAREKIIKDCSMPKSIVVVNGEYISSTDATVAKSFAVMREELAIREQSVIFWNFKRTVMDVLVGMDSSLTNIFREGELDHVIKDMVEEPQITVQTEP